MSRVGMGDDDDTPNRSIATVWAAQDEARQAKRREENARRRETALAQRRLDDLIYRARLRANNMGMYPDIDHEQIFADWLLANAPDMVVGTWGMGRGPYEIRGGRLYLSDRAFLASFDA